MKRLTLTLTLSVAMAAGIILAQDGPMGHQERRKRTPDAVISALSLTPEQVTALQENRRAKREAIRDSPRRPLERGSVSASFTLGPGRVRSWFIGPFEAVLASGRAAVTGLIGARQAVEVVAGTS